MRFTSASKAPFLGLLTLVGVACSVGTEPSDFGRTAQAVTSANACQQLDLTATREHPPAQSTDGRALVDSPRRYRIPASIPIVEGPATSKATLTFTNAPDVPDDEDTDDDEDGADHRVRCTYRSQSPSGYALVKCSHGLAAGTIVEALRFRLHLVGGNGVPRTVARVTLDEVQPCVLSLPPSSDGPSPPAVLVSWSRTTGTLGSTDELSAIVKNTTSHKLTARVSITGFGLDQREVKKELGTFDLEKNKEKTVSILVRDIPIQSIGNASELEVRAEIVDASQLLPVVVPSPPVYLRYSEDFQTVTLLGNTAPRFPVGDVSNQQQFAIAVQAAAPQAFDVRGRVLGPGGQIVDVATLRPPPGSAVIPGTTVVLGGTAPPGPPPHPPAPPPPPFGSVDARFCTSWKATFIDAGLGETVDLGRMSGPAPYDEAPARFTTASLWQVGTPTAIWSGLLDENGCTPHRLVDPGGFFLIQEPVLSPPISLSPFIEIYLRKDGDGKKVVSAYLTGFTIGDVSAVTVLMRPTAMDQVTRVAAAATQILATPDNGLVPLSAYVVHADESCPADGDACFDHRGALADTNEVYFAKNLDTRFPAGAHNTEWKSIVAHEFGHMVQHYAFGWSVRSDFVAGSTTSILSCACAHVAEGAGRAHCLTSRHNDARAQEEGYGHFYASRVWNVREEPVPLFIYYKDSWDELVSTLARVDPPKAILPRAKRQWEKNHCLSTQTGVERDWLGFFYEINTASAATRTTLPALADIYQRSCNTSGVRCDDAGTVHSAELTTAARTKYGATSDRFLRFDAAARDFGVDH